MAGAGQATTLDRLIGEDGKLAYISLDEQLDPGTEMAAYPVTPTSRTVEQEDPTWYELVSRAAGVPPTWRPGDMFEPGDLATHSNAVYRCVRAHTASSGSGAADSAPDDGDQTGWYSSGGSGAATGLAAGEYPTAFSDDDDLIGDLIVGDSQILNSIPTFPTTPGAASSRSSDAACPVIVTDLAEVTSWDFGITRPEVDLTALLDEERRFRYGRDDWTGTVSGLVSVTERELQGRFVREKRIRGAAGSVTSEIVPRNTLPIAFFGYVQKRKLSGDHQRFLYLPVIELGGWTFGATDGSRQEFSSGMRLGDDRLRRSPTMYDREIPAAA